jgi:hypothetical protein
LPQLGFIIGCKDHKGALDSGCSRTLDDLVQVGGKLGSRDMAVTVYQHGFGVSPKSPC